MGGSRFRIIWNSDKGVISRTAWEKANEKLKQGSISRASVINYLDDLREMRVLRCEQVSGKGGFHAVYYPLMNEGEFKRFIAEKLIASLRESFPEETREAIKNVS